MGASIPQRGDAWGDSQPGAPRARRLDGGSAALAAPPTPVCTPKPSALWGERGELGQTTRGEALGGSERCPGAGMGAGRGVCTEAPAADLGRTPKPCQGCERWDAGADKGSSFQPQRSRGAMPAGRDGAGTGQGRLQPSGRRCRAERGGMCRGRPGGSREGVERVIRAGGCESANDA